MIMCIKKLTKFRVINNLHPKIHIVEADFGYLEVKIT